ncbi:MAG: winged helix DNA-binding domain-containing protein [Actinobacteria bacterium]|nr:winged helix DNA-binding domain-containing protein [Actinomycetota bacterium]MCI0678413.1 winged helix DNA-binding domain-containing protein [Actinomycetota bacterium]
MRRLTLDQARRYALAAQGMTEPRPSGRIDARHFRRVVGRIGVVQLDSVNVFARTHFMPFFSRLGPYDRDRLNRWLWGSGEMFEYWAHMASVVPSAHHRLFRWRMDREGIWKTFQETLDAKPDYLDRVLDQVRVFGPIQTSELDDPGHKRGDDAMWNWSEGKMALEYLFMKGAITIAARPNFTRVYDITDRVLASRHLDGETPPIEEAQRELLLMAARSLGVGTAEDLADYYRIRMPEARPLIKELAAAGRLIEVEVEGWGPRPAYLHPEAALPRRPVGTALLSPFDNLVFFRDRVERLWDFHYRIEIYVPPSKRVYGYYVLPFLMDGRLVARVDLKTDRQTRALLVRGAFAEPGVDRVAVGLALAEELEMVAAWLGLDDVKVSRNGDLSTFL